MIKLGRYKAQEVCFDEKKAMNKNILLVGKSGGGKSVEAQKLMLEIAKQGRTVVALDWHQALNEEEILETHRGEFSLYINNIDVYSNGILCSLFEPLTHPDNVTEQIEDIIGATIDTLDRTLKFGYGQKAVLRTVIRQIIEEDGYEEGGFAMIDNMLERINTPIAKAVREKLYPLTIHNVFRSGDLFIQHGKINVVRLSRFDLGTQETVAEMLLAYIWRLAMVNHFKDKEIFLFVDECQNLPSGKRSALAQMLCEGRKFGVNLILATQQLMQTSASIIQQRLTQCGLILYFQPDLGQIRAITKMIDPEAEKGWMQVLRNLQRGEFVAAGTLALSGHQVERPLKVSAFEYVGKERILQ